MIPTIAHFIWFGKHLPWAHGLAVISAARRGGFAKVLLHHHEELISSEVTKALDMEPSIEMRCLRPSELFANTKEYGLELDTLYNRLESPAAKANMIRAALLFSDGGVYLDTDTITLRNFGPLLDTGIFCGTERIVLPGALLRRHHPLPWLAAGLKLVIRDICRRLPNGWRTFRFFEHLYPPKANNAVLGAEREHPFCLALLEKMARMEPQRQLKRFGLGTYLLQELVAEYRGTDLSVHPPEYFYPLGPEISQHWFRRHPESHLTRVLSEKTFCIHWYGSVRTSQLIPLIEPDYIRSRAESQWFSSLTVSLLPR